MRLLSNRRRGVGYLLKSRVSDVKILAEAIRRVGGGGAVVDPRVVELLVNRKRADDPLAALSARERETLALMAEGCSNEAISARLVLSPKTVESHIRAIFAQARPAADPRRQPPGARGAHLPALVGRGRDGIRAALRTRRCGRALRRAVLLRVR